MKILNEHRNLKQSTDRLLALLERALHDTILPRAQLIESGHRFVQENCDHMRREELQPFRQARECLTASDWRAVDADADALRERTGLESGRQQYEAILATLHAVED